MTIGNGDTLRLFVQGAIALAVLAGATYLGVRDVLDSEAISVLYGAALGAVGASGYRAAGSHTTTQTYRPAGPGDGEIVTRKETP